MRNGWSTESSCRGVGVAARLLSIGVDPRNRIFPKRRTTELVYRNPAEKRKQNLNRKMATAAVWRLCTLSPRRIFASTAIVASIVGSSPWNLRSGRTSFLLQHPTGHSPLEIHHNPVLQQQQPTIVATDYTKPILDTQSVRASFARTMFYELSL